MKAHYLQIVSLFLLSILLAACGLQPTANPAVPTTNPANPTENLANPTANPTSNEGTIANTEVASTAVQGVVAEDFNTLVDALQMSGVTVESGEDVTQPFFSVTGKIIRINGQDAQVYVYDSPQALEAEASQIAADGSSIGTNMPSWMDDPHFYKSGRMLLLYVGQDQKLLDILTGIMGAQFAGR